MNATINMVNKDLH